MSRSQELLTLIESEQDQTQLQELLKERIDRATGLNSTDDVVRWIEREMEGKDRSDPAWLVWLRLSRSERRMAANRLFSWYRDAEARKQFRRQFLAKPRPVPDSAGYDDDSLQYLIARLIGEIRKAGSRTSFSVAMGDIIQHDQIFQDFPTSTYAEDRVNIVLNFVERMESQAVQNEADTHRWPTQILDLVEIWQQVLQILKTSGMNQGLRVRLTDLESSSEEFEGLCGIGVKGWIFEMKDFIQALIHHIKDRQ